MKCFEKTFNKRTTLFYLQISTSMGFKLQTDMYVRMKLIILQQTTLSKYLSFNMSTKTDSSIRRNASSDSS